jgi:hypothetical protein
LFYTAFISNLLTYFFTSELVTSTTPRPRPPWFPETPPNGWAELEASSNSTTTTTTRRTSSTEGEDNDTEERENERDYADTLDLGAGVTPRVIKVKVPKPFPMEPAAGAGANNAKRLFPGAEERRREEEESGARLKDLVGRTVAQIPRQDQLLPSSTNSRNINSESGSNNNKNSNQQPVLLSLANFTQYCPPVTARGLFWNWTGAGETAVMECPSGSIGFAKWRCGHPHQSSGGARHLDMGQYLDGGSDDADDGSANNGGRRTEWTGLSPSLVECQSKWLNNLDARLRDGESVATVSGDLAGLSGRQALYGGDLQLATKMLKHMAERMHYDVQGLSGGAEGLAAGGGHDPDQQESLVTELVQNVVLAASNVLDRANHAAWADLPGDEAAAAATALMSGLEENAFLLADLVRSEKIIIKPTTNICK